MNGNMSGSQMKYGSAASGGANFGSVSAQGMSSNINVNPHDGNANTSVGKATSWRSEGGVQSGQGTFLNFNTQKPQG